MMNDSPLLSEHDFLMGLRQSLLGMVALIEQKLGLKPTTKEKSTYWKLGHTDIPDYSEPDTT